MKIALGFLFAFAIGFACRYFGIPVPWPPHIVSALLVVTMTVGFIAADYVLHQP